MKGTCRLDRRIDLKLRKSSNEGTMFFQHYVVMPAELRFNSTPKDGIKTKLEAIALSSVLCSETEQKMP